MNEEKALAALPRIAALSVALTTEIELAKLPNSEAALALALTLAAMTRQNQWAENFIEKVVRESFAVFDGMIQNIDHGLEVPARVRKRALPQHFRAK